MSLAPSASQSPPRAGSSEAWVQSVSETKTGWNASAARPTTASTSAYPMSGFESRAEKRAQYAAPAAMPPMNTASTRDCAYAAWPRKSFRYCVQIDS